MLYRSLLFLAVAVTAIPSVNAQEEGPRLEPIPLNQPGVATETEPLADEATQPAETELDRPDKSTGQIEEVTYETIDNERQSTEAIPTETTDLESEVIEPGSLTTESPSIEGRVIESSPGPVLSEPVTGHERAPSSSVDVPPNHTVVPSTRTLSPSTRGCTPPNRRVYIPVPTATATRVTRGGTVVRNCPPNCVIYETRPTTYRTYTTGPARQVVVTPVRPVTRVTTFEVTPVRPVTRFTTPVRPATATYRVVPSQIYRYGSPAVVPVRPIQPVYWDVPGQPVRNAVRRALW